jgi:hypothetical protein
VEEGASNESTQDNETPAPDIQALLTKVRKDSSMNLMGMYGELKMTPSEWQHGKNPDKTSFPVKPKRQDILQKVHDYVEEKVIMKVRKDFPGVDGNNLDTFSKRVITEQNNLNIKLSDVVDRIVKGEDEKRSLAYTHDYITQISNEVGRIVLDILQKQRISHETMLMKNINAGLVDSVLKQLTPAFRDTTLLTNIVKKDVDYTLRIHLNEINRIKNKVAAGQITISEGVVQSNVMVPDIIKRVREHMQTESKTNLLDRQRIEQDVAQQIEQEAQRHAEEIHRTNKRAKYIKLAGNRDLPTLQNELRGITRQIEQKATIASKANKQYTSQFETPLRITVPPGLVTLQPIFNNLRSNRKLSRADARTIHKKLQFALGDIQGLRKVGSFKDQYINTNDSTAASHSFTKLLQGRRGYRVFTNKDALNIVKIISPDRLGDIPDIITDYKTDSHTRKVKLDSLEIRKVQLTRIIRAMEEHTAAQVREKPKAKPSQKKTGRGFRSRVGALLKKRSEMPKIKAPKKKKRKTPKKKSKLPTPKTPSKPKMHQKESVEINSPPLFKMTKSKTDGFVHRKKKKYL